MFDIHKVKPVHGWREFVGEVGIIVLGVLIALSAEQIVEIIHWRNEVRETTAALNVSLANSRAQALERIYLNPCIKSQIKAAKTFVTSTDSGMPVKVHSTPIRPWDESSWTTAMSSGAVTHMPLEVRSRYARLYDTVAILKQSNAEEFTIWSDIASLNLDHHLTDVSRDRLIADLARASSLNFLVVIASQQLNEKVKKLAIPFSDENINDMREDLGIKCVQ